MCLSHRILRTLGPGHPPWSTSMSSPIEMAPAAYDHPPICPIDQGRDRETDRNEPKSLRTMFTGSEACILTSMAIPHVGLQRLSGKGAITNTVVCPRHFKAWRNVADLAHVAYVVRSLRR